MRKILFLILLLTISAKSYCQMPNLNTKDRESIKPYRNGGLYGFVEDGKILIPCKYDNVWEFSGGLARVELNGKMGCINKAGRTMVPITYDFVYSFSDGLAAVKLDGKYGYVNNVGENVIPFLYDYAGSFSDGLALVQVGGHYGYIDREGRYITPVVYNQVETFYHGLAKVRKNFFWGVVNSQGKEVIPCKYDDIGYIREGMIEVKKGDLWGFVDSLGVEVIPPQFIQVSSFDNGLCRVSNADRKWSCIDKQGTPLTKFIYDDIMPFYEGMAAVKKNKKWGFINEKGDEIIPCVYDYKWNGSVLKFSNGLALVQKGRRYKDYLYINKANEIVYKFSKKTSPLPTTWRSYFSDGVAWIVSEDNLGNFVVLSIINTAGQVLKTRSAYELNLHHTNDMYALDRFKNGYSFTGGKLIDKNIEIAAEINGDSLYYKDEKALIELAKRYYEKGSFNTSLKILKRMPTNSYAQYVVGFMTQYGQGTEANEQEAIKWYKKSNEPEAKRQLAMLEGKDNFRESLKKEEPVLLADSKVREKKSERITQQFPVKPNTVVAETSQEKIVAQNTSQVQEQSKQLTIVEEKKEKRIALLIGNAKYRSEDGFMPLTSPENDVYDLKRALEKLGFLPIVRTNLDQSDMEEVIQNFCDTIKNYDVALFYYSGHAFQNRGVLRLAPVNEDFSKPGHRDNAVRFDFVLNTLIDSEVKTKILILDACRSRKPFKGVDDRWTTPTNHGCFVAFATRAGENANDGEQNSVYTKALLESLNLQGDLDHIFNDVEQKVYERTSNDDCESLQLPVHNNELFPRAFYLNK